MLKPVYIVIGVVILAVLLVASFFGGTIFQNNQNVVAENARQAQDQAVATQVAVLMSSAVPQATATQIIVQPTPTMVPPSPTPTVTPMAVYVYAVSCTDPRVIDFVSDNNERLRNFHSIEMQAISHFPHGHQKGVDTAGYEDLDLKMGKVVVDISGLYPPPSLRNFYESERQYIASLAGAVSAGRRKDSSEALAEFSIAMSYKNSMDYYASFYTCGHLFPSK